MATIYALIKLVERKEYAEWFMNGKLFMNTIRAFKDYRDEAGELRGDPYEGIAALYQPEKISEITVGDIVIPNKDIVGPIIYHSDELLAKNAFCMYALNSRGYDSVSADTLRCFRRTVEIHNSCFGLGSYCVLVKNAQEFIDRCVRAIKKQDFAKASLGLVDYFDEQIFHGSLPEDRHGYQKSIRYMLQREYRILIDTERAEPEPYTLDVGDLSDITVLTTPLEFNAQLEMMLPDGSIA